MSDLLSSTARGPCGRAGMMTALAAGALSLCLSAGLARADACPMVAEGVALCLAGTPWQADRIERYEDVTAWEGEDFFIEFNPALTEAAGDGPLEAAVQQLMAALLEAEADLQATPLSHDAVEHGDAHSARAVYHIVEEGETYLGAVIVTDFPAGAAPRLAWAVGSFDPVEPEDILGVIDATAAGLRPATEN